MSPSVVAAGAAVVVADRLAPAEPALGLVAVLALVDGLEDVGDVVDVVGDRGRVAVRAGRGVVGGLDPVEAEVGGPRLGGGHGVGAAGLARRAVGGAGEQLLGGLAVAGGERGGAAVDRDERGGQFAAVGDAGAARDGGRLAQRTLGARPVRAQPLGAVGCRLRRRGREQARQQQTRGHGEPPQEGEEARVMVARWSRESAARRSGERHFEVRESAGKCADGSMASRDRCIARSHACASSPLPSSWSW